MRRTNGILYYSLLALCTASLIVGAPISRAAESNAQPAKDQPPKRLDTITGFRGQKFGTAFSDFQDLTLEKDEGDIKLYVKKAENLALRPVHLETIVYHFFQDKFFAVSLHTQTRDNTLLLLRVAQVAFGKSKTQPSESQDLDQSWLGKFVEVFFNVNPKTEEGSLFIRDNQIGAEVEAYREKVISEAADSL